jgi:hypothetical protein
VSVHTKQSALPSKTTTLQGGIVDCLPGLQGGEKKIISSADLFFPSRRKIL